ncbi:lectin-like domain-containing protein [Pollutibacter soli]|uniref:lectin-like domain-containing protein n=1 Tax=Pollutibacter soli TaxID=3034157 RepID=UPI003013450B
MLYLHTLVIRIFLPILFFAIASIAEAQVSNPYFLNGNATQDNCNCYTLTSPVLNQSGSVWNIYKIDLRENFDFKFSVFLGTIDQQGADGIAFVLQPISTNIGSVGGGLGFENVTPSVGVTIDTWQNTNNNDPDFDHIAIQRDGDLNHNSANNLAGPVTAISNGPNIEDGQWHLFRIEWNAATKVYKASVDGVERVSTNIDLISTVFRGDPMVFWGFTGSTGGSVNLQRFCTALNPGIRSISNNVTCYGTPIQFVDSSASFGKIVKWFWDLGDGTTDTLQTIPAHLYSAPGIYNVRLNILGNNGCISDTFRLRVIVGSDPIAKPAYEPQKLCEGRPFQLMDSSTVEFGTINNWQWKVNGTTYTSQHPDFPSGMPVGTIPISLQVKTAEGCVSDTATRNLKIDPVPGVSFTASNVCAGEELNLYATNITSSVPVSKWIWYFNGVADSSGANIQLSFDAAGTYPVKLEGIAANGCNSDVFTENVNVFATNAFAGRDTIVAIDQPFQLQGSGGVSYSWSPPFGLSDPNIANPVGRFSDDAQLIMTASSPAGCASSDTIRVRVFKGPEIYVPTAFTPNGDNKNDVLKAFPVGLKFQFLKVYDRWGKLIFSTSDFNIGWDGRVNARLADSGNFIWVTQGIQNDGKLFSKKGIVTLIR